MAFTDPTRSYEYSFSGSDARAWAFYDSLEEDVSPLDSLHTISISVHEAKGPARALGFRGVKGYARGVRTIAGTMIFTIVKDHPLRNLIDQYGKAVDRGWSGGWSVDQDEVGVGTAFNNIQFTNRLATLLPPFNILCQYVSESANWSTPDTRATWENTGVGYSRPTSFEGAAWMLKGIEIIDIGMVTSTNDIVTEMTASFTAVDFKPMSRNEFTGTARPSKAVHSVTRIAADLAVALYPDQGGSGAYRTILRQIITKDE